MDGNVRSVKVYMLAGFTALNYTYRAMDLLTEQALLALVVPTFVAWLIAHVVQRREQIKTNGGN